LELDEVMRVLDADRTQRDLRTIPTGSLGLDLALGGGLHRGKIAELSGDYSTYKTAFAMHIVAQAQTLGRVLWLDSGSDFNPKHARQVGVNLGLLTVCYPDDADRALYTMRIAAQDYALMVVDSASGLECDEPQHKIERWFSWLKTDIYPHATALFISNEYATREQSFAHELGKWATTQVHMLPNTGRRRVEAVIAKDASVTPVNYRMRYRFRNDASFDAEYEVVKLAESAGVIELRGNWAYFRGEVLGNGVSRCVDRLRKDPVLYLKLRDAIRTELS
jgi:recombination protein RecA